MANVLTPQVAGIHFDDLEQLFHLKITFQIKSPLGNFEREVKLTASDLAGIIQQIIAIWGGASPTTEATQLNFQPGNLADLGTAIGALTPLPTMLASIPVSPDSDRGTDLTWGTYVGTTDDTGGLGTTWGSTGA
jgi:hypothetical protein